MLAEPNTSRMSTVIWGQLKKEFRGLMRHPGQWCYPLSFFLWVVALFPLSIGPEPALLERMASGAIWIAALLASYLAYSRIFAQDFASGLLHQHFLSPIPEVVLVYARILSHWGFHGFPIVLLTPILSLWMGLEPSLLVWLMASLLLGTLAIYVINALMAALTLHANVGGALVMLLGMPLQVPVVILGNAVVEAAMFEAVMFDGGVIGGLALMGSLTCFLFFTVPFMIGSILKLMVSA